MEYLDLSNNDLTEIDLNRNKKLKHLDLNNNKLTEIDVSKLSKLEYLDISNNNIKVKGLEKLKNLKCLKGNFRIRKTKDIVFCGNIIYFKHLDKVFYNNKYYDLNTFLILNPDANIILTKD